MNPISPWLDPVELRRLAENLLAPANPVLTPPPSDAGFDSAFVGFASNSTTTPPEPSPPAAAEEPNPPTAAESTASSLSERSTGVPPVTEDSTSRLPEQNTGVPPVTEASASRLSERSTGVPPVTEDSASRLPERNTGVPPVTEDSASRLSERSTGVPPVTEDRRDACPPAEVQPEPRSLARIAFSERMQRFRDWLSHHFAATGVFVLDRNGGVIFDDSGHGRFHFLARSLATTSRQPGAPAGNVHVKIGTSGTLEVIPVETPFGWIILGAVVPDALPPAAVVVIIDALSQAAAPPRRTTA